MHRYQLKRKVNKILENPNWRISELQIAIRDHNRWRKRNMKPSHKDEVRDLVCKRFGLNHRDIFKKTKKREIVYPRFYCFRLMYELGFNYSQIGRVYQVNHVTVMNGCSQIQNWMECNDSEVIETMDYFRKQLDITN